MHHKRPELLGMGSISIVYKITETIAVKRAKNNDDDKQVINEYHVFDLLDKYPSCPNIVQSFYRIPSAIFLDCMAGGTLDQRLRVLQTRDVHDMVIKVDYTQPTHLVWRWLAELTDAIAWLEHLGLAHADLRPPNLLLDSEDHLKVSDFDCTTATGEVFEGMQPPYARVLGKEGAKDRGTFGYCGSRTEQFAIGSVIYAITRGFEPYENEWLGEEHGEKVVDLLQAMVFPPTSNSEMDTIIRSCWYGTFESVRHLNSKVMKICPGIRSTMAEPMNEVDIETAKQQCKQLVAEGLLDQAPRRLVTLPGSSAILTTQKARMILVL